MNKKDILPVAIIFALLVAYPFIDRAFVAKLFPAKARPAPVAEAAPDTSGGAGDPPAESPSEPPALAATPEPESEPAPVTSDAAEAAPDLSLPHPDPVPVILSNDVARFVLSTRGAAVVHADMCARRPDGTLLYPLSADSPDTSVYFEFADRPAAAFATPPFTADTDFELVDSTPRSATFRAVSTASNLALERRVTLDNAYSLTFEDRLVALVRTVSPPPVALALQSGWMGNLPGEAFDARLPLLGVDTLSGSAVKFWGNKLDSWFRDKSEGLVQSRDLSQDLPSVEWAAVKDKYFVQILRPVDLPSRVTVHARRGAPVPTRSFLIFPSQAYPFDSVSATLDLPPVATDPDAAPLVTELYLGPKVYDTLLATGYHREDVLQLGFWRVIGIWILKLMVWFRNHVWPFNYGLSIILLTLLIRVIFWPLNHKSLASTRRMQEIQPLVAEIREKYKKDPQRQQQEMMRIYKENKINPLGGCLPMLIQIPVFFALFVVLRGAIELRFSSFLWIADLSTPENLFADVLPVPLNILPLFMGVTMWLQQKMTPTSDPQQQKMMLMMPILFTVLFYSFPSGLSLYWSTNQILMILQLALMRRKQAAAAPAR